MKGNGELLRQTIDLFVQPFSSKKFVQTMKREKNAISWVSINIGKIIAVNQQLIDEIVDISVWY